MAISPVQGQANLLSPPTGYSPKSGAVPATSAAPAPTPVKEGAGIAPTPPHRKARESDPHDRAAADGGLEVRLHVLPEADATILQFVDPCTKQVVREFPAEDLVRALAAIRAGTGLQLDETA